MAMSVSRDRGAWVRDTVMFISLIAIAVISGRTAESVARRFLSPKSSEAIGHFVQLTLAFAWPFTEVPGYTSKHGPVVRLLAALLFGAFCAAGGVSVTWLMFK